jgi:hypothetical protein
VVGVGDGVGGSLVLAGGDGEVALGARLDVDRLCVSETGVLVRVQVQQVALEIREILQSDQHKRVNMKSACEKAYSLSGEDGTLGMALDHE